MEGHRSRAGNRRAAGVDPKWLNLSTYGLPQEAAAAIYPFSGRRCSLKDSLNTNDGRARRVDSIIVANRLARPLLEPYGDFRLASDLHTAASRYERLIGAFFSCEDPLYRLLHLLQCRSPNFPTGQARIPEQQPTPPFPAPPHEASGSRAHQQLRPIKDERRPAPLHRLIHALQRRVRLRTCPRG
jgi:hypothetical protein